MWENEVLTIPAADFTDIGFDLTVFEYTKGLLTGNRIDWYQAFNMEK